MTASGAAVPMDQLLRSRPLFGMIHLPALPGSPGSSMSLDDVRRFAVAEAR